MSSIAAMINWGDLFEVIYVSLTITLAVSLAYSLLLYGAVRSVDKRREGAAAASAAFGVLAVIGGLAVAAVVIFGFSIIIK